MRISTATMFEKGTARMGEMQSSLARTQQQVATGRKLLSPADDPVASARALEVKNSQDINAAYAVNRRYAKDTLSSAEGALQSVTSLLQDVKTLVVQAGNGVLDAQQRQFIATDLQGRFDELVGLANTTDGVGNYIFSGYQASTKPFTATATGAAYAGDQGPRMMRVNTARELEVTQNGFALFENVTAIGVYAASHATSSNGTGTISAGAVVDSAALTGSGYVVDIADVAGVLSYTVTDDDGNSVATGEYLTGEPITFAGLQYTITGGVDGSSFDVVPDKSQSVFSTLKNLIGVLQAPAGTPNDKAIMAGGLGVANGNIDHAIDHILTARAAIGANLKEIESLDSLGEDLNVQYATTLSELQDLDYVEAITALTRQQVSLQAAQQSFVKLSNLSLFNFLS